MQRFEPHFVGVRSANENSLLSPEQCLLVNRGRFGGPIAEVAFTLTGAVPRLWRGIERLNPALIHSHNGVNAALSGNILRLTGDRLLWSTLTTSARSLVERTYDLRGRTTALEETYAEVARRHRSARPPAFARGG
jgi:hypothetical protein